MQLQLRRGGLIIWDLGKQGRIARSNAKVDEMEIRERIFDGWHEVPRYAWVKELNAANGTNYD